MHVVEDKPHGVIAHGLHLDDRHVPLAANGLAFGGRMPLHFRARAHDAQIFGREFERLAAFKGDAERPPVLFESYLRRPGLGAHAALLSPHPRPSKKREPGSRANASAPGPRIAFRCASCVRGGGAMTLSQREIQIAEQSLSATKYGFLLALAFCTS